MVLWSTLMDRIQRLKVMTQNNVYHSFHQTVIIAFCQGFFVGKNLLLLLLLFMLILSKYVDA